MPGRSQDMPISNEPLNALAGALQRVREKCNLSVEEVAAASGVRAAKLLAYEAGTAEATLLEVSAVAKATGTTAQSLSVDAGL